MNVFAERHMKEMAELAMRLNRTQALFVENAAVMLDAMTPHHTHANAKRAMKAMVMYA